MKKSRTKIKEALVHTLQPGYSATSNRIEMASAGLLETLLSQFSSSVAANDITSQCLVRQSKWDTFMKAIVKKMFYSPLLKGLVAWFIKQHVDAAIVKCRLTHLHSDVRIVDEKEVLLRPCTVFVDATKCSQYAQAQKLQTLGRKKNIRSIIAEVTVTKKF